MALISIRLKWTINLGIPSFKNTLCLFFCASSSTHNVILENFIEPSSPCRSNTNKQHFTNIDSNELIENFNKTDWDKIIYENGKNLNSALNSFYNSRKFLSTIRQNLKN